MNNRRRLLMAIANQYPWIPYAMDYLYERLVPQTIDGRVVKDKAKLGTIYGNGAIENQLDRHLTFNNNNSKYYSCSVDTATGLYTLEIIKEVMPTAGNSILAYPDIIFDSNVSANNKILIYYDVVENTLNGADRYKGQLWIYSTDGYSVLYKEIPKGQHAGIISVSANQTSAHMTAIFRPLGNRTIREQEVGNKIRFYLRVCNLTKMYGAGNEPTTIDDPRIKKILSRGDIPYNAGEYRPSIINAIEYHRLPSEFQEVEYLESTGTQYIDTGFKASGNTKIEIKYQTPTQSTTQMGVFGSRHSHHVNCFLVFTGASKNALQADYYNSRFGGEDWYKYDISGFDGTAINVIEMSNYLKLNGNLVKTLNPATFQSEINLFLFAVIVNISGELNRNLMIGNIWYCKLWNDSTLVRNYIPCYRKSDNVAGLYDLVNGVFYTNAGTGEFLVGNDVVSKIELPAPLSLDGAMKAHNTFEVTKTDYVFTRNVSNIDLATLNWTGGSYTFTCTNFPSNRKLATYGRRINALYAKYDVGGAYGSSDVGSFEDKHIYSNYYYAYIIYVKDVTFTDVNALKQSLQGIPFYYELANPQIIHIPKRHLGYYVINSDMVIGDTIILADIKPNTTNLWCDFGTLSGTTLTITKNVSSGTTLFYETENETDDFINLLSIESGGNITADCDGALPNAELKFKWGKQ